MARSHRERHAPRLSAGADTPQSPTPQPRHVASAATPVGHSPGTIPPSGRRRLHSCASTA
ncbi:hypothetical protein HMPREF0321_1644 [Dermacoccus sp. Ellin185]|nr:hypothetical protein HMPREF0321_1644 [Dermacoccus sp. Ellin185]